MDFFGVGLGEVLLILIIALVIWGPKRLPEIARTMGKTVRTLRKATSDLTTQITREIDIEESESRERKQPPSSQKSGTAERDTGEDE
jgi:sec-independent protein translocase protein TatA